MTTEQAAVNARCIEREIEWFRALLTDRLDRHARGGVTGDLLGAHPAPPLPGDRAPYAEVVRQFDLGPAERLLLVLGLLPHIRPDVLDPFLIHG